MKKLKQLMTAGILILTSSLGWSGNSVRDSAESSKKANQMGQVVNMAVGAANLYAAKKCFSSCSASGSGCCPMAPVFLMMGIQSLAQAGAQGKAAGESGVTLGLTDASGGLGGDYNPDAVKQLASDPQLKEGLDFMTSVSNADPVKNGIAYDPATQTVTTADGKKIKPGDVGSTAAMEGAGMSKGMIDTISNMEQKIIAGAMKKVDKLGLKGTMVSTGEESGSGGGSGSSTSAATPADYNGMFAGQGKGAGLGIDRDPAQVAGMQKNYNGEPIGVSADSIFKMMNRRYKVKESQSSFLEEAELLRQK